MGNICFVILNYRQANFTIPNIKELREYYPGACFVAVDNNSEDGSYDKIKRAFIDDPYVRTIHNASNEGYAVGNNVGIREAIKSFNPEYIAIMNPDVIIEDKKIVPSIIKAFCRDKALAFATGLMLDNQKRLNPKTIAWKVPDKLDDCLLNLPYLPLRLGISKYISFELDEYDKFCVGAIPGSFFIARTDHFRKMGFFDENTFLYCEERILGYRAKQLGFKVAIIPGVFFIHNHPRKKEPFMSITKSYFYLIKSRYYYNKVYNSWPKWIILPLFVVSAMTGYLLTAVVWLLRRIILPR